MAATTIRISDASVDATSRGGFATQRRQAAIATPTQASAPNRSTINDWKTR